MIEQLSVRVGPLVFGPVEWGIGVVAVLVAAWALINLSLIARREAVQQRIANLHETLVRREEPTGPQAQWYDFIMAGIAKLPVFGSEQQAKMIAELASAGIKSPHRLGALIGSKLALALLLPTALWLLLFAGGVFPPGIRVALLVAALIIGWFLPNFVLKRLISARRQRIELGMPDALDLLVICAEAGLGLEQAIAQVSRDMVTSSPDIADEFATTADEMHVSPDRHAALENLAVRCGLDGLRSIIATLTQSLEYGTPLSESLRVLAGEMRGLRMARFEERGARVPVLLTLPLVLFLMPALFMVVIGPSILRVIDTVSH